MKKYFSSYLDLARFIAAVAVVLDHFVTDHVVSASLARFLPTIGREAVVTFFVLSGFVIAYVTDFKKQTLAAYAVARAARIYSVALPLLLSAFIVVYILKRCTGMSLELDYQVNKFYLYIPFQSLFLGELWRTSETPVWLNAYWSLNYEVWYYLFFGAVFFLRGRTRLLFSTVIFLVLGYKLWLLLPVWWAGAQLWYLRDRIRISIALARWGCLFSIGLLCLYKYLHCDDYLRSAGNALWPFPHLPLGSADRYLGDYVVAAMVLLNFYCAQHAQFSLSDTASRRIRVLASYTFSLYLTHSLVISVWQSFHAGAASGSEVALLSAGIILATWLVGIGAESFRGWLEAFFTRISNFLGATVYGGTHVVRGRK